MPERDQTRSAACSCGSPRIGYDPECPLHGTAVRTQPDFFINGKPVTSPNIFPDLDAHRGE